MKIETHPKDNAYIEELMDTFKSKIQNGNTSKYDQYKMLTCVPDSWTIHKIMEFFSVSEHMARYSKKLRQEHGAFSCPTPKTGKKLPESTLNAVKDFLSDTISRVLPGRKDYVTVRENGQREQRQKRLLLSTCKEAYIEFKNQNPNIRIGSSMFTKLKPKEINPFNVIT